TSVARALCDQLSMDYIMLNGSVEGNIDTLRNKIVGYASAVSLTGDRKCIIVDEADYLNPKSTQPAFRGVIEEFADNCSFIFTCNYKNRLIEPLQSRCTVIDFQIAPVDRPKLAGQLMKRIKAILTENKIDYDKGTIVELINRYFPDFRRVLNELQRYSVSGKIDAGIFDTNTTLDECISLLKAKDFWALQKWVSNNVYNDTNQLMHDLYLQLKNIVKREFIPVTVVMIGKYQYQGAFCPDKDLNLMCLFSELMLEVEFLP
ncbi:MAG: AAA family ATPase, partial [Candidatus Dormibacteria bacterium]